MSRKIAPEPEPCVRVIHKSGAWLRSPAVSPLGVVAPMTSDLSGLTTTRVLTEASAWPLSRALTIARMFDGAYVDRVEAALGTTDHHP